MIRRVMVHFTARTDFKILKLFYVLMQFYCEVPLYPITQLIAITLGTIFAS